MLHVNCLLVCLPWVSVLQCVVDFMECLSFKKKHLFCHYKEIWCTLNPKP